MIASHGYLEVDHASDVIFTAEDFAEAESYRTLGPAYFAARRQAEAFMAAFEAEHFAPLIKKFASDFQDKLWSDLENSLLSDTESNLQTSVWRMVDSSVKALLGGDRWALERYALGDKYDCGEIRAAVAKHIPAELQDKRIAELEAEVASLKADLASERSCRGRY
jgi:hypothetical protein